MGFDVRNVGASPFYYLCTPEEQTPARMETGSTELKSRTRMLREAIEAVQHGRKGETDLTDHLKTYRWVQNAILSSQTKAEIQFEE